MTVRSTPTASVVAPALWPAESRRRLHAGALLAVPATMISAYERGKRQPTLPTLIRLLDAAGFELRLHLEVSDPHDAVLAELEAQRDPTEREACDRQQDAWRRAVDLGPIATVKP